MHTIKILPVVLPETDDNPNDEDASTFQALATIEAAAFNDTSSVASDGTKKISISEVLFGPTTEAGRIHRAEEQKNKLREDKTYRIFKAIVVSSSGEEEIAAFSAWHYYDEPQPVQEWVDKEWPHMRSPSGLNEFFGGFARERNRFMGGKKYAHLEILATHPAYQRQGIGKQLLLNGILEAERRGLPAWLEASHDGYPLYRSVGFEDMAQTEIDLAKYGSEGIAKHVCMLKPLPS